MATIRVVNVTAEDKWVNFIYKTTVKCGKYFENPLLEQPMC